MTVQSPQLLDSLSTAVPGIPDSILLLFASPERRCLGVPKILNNYRADRVMVIEVIDEPNEDRAKNIDEIEQLCQKCGELKRIHFKHSDLVFGVQNAAAVARSVTANRRAVTIDISTFPRNALLLFLRFVDTWYPECPVRLVYTEPAEYSEPGRAAFGLKQITTIPTFVAPFRPSGELALIIQLGFEGDRALGVWQCVEPHKTVAIIPRPAYRPEWEGASERLNAALLAPLETENIRYVNPRDPASTYRLLQDITTDSQFHPDTNFFVAPVGTKPEAVGLYAFCRDFPNRCTVLYSSNATHSRGYISQGIGAVWQLDYPPSSHQREFHASP